MNEQKITVKISESQKQSFYRLTSENMWIKKKLEAGGDRGCEGGGRVGGEEEKKNEKHAHCYITW